MNIGDLVHYKPYPHKELHNSGVTGVVVSSPRLPDWSTLKDAPLVVDVIWSVDRGTQYPAGTVVWDYVDDLETVK